MAGVWRWRHNPLRRATDRCEAWLALAAFLMLMLAAPAVGWLCGVRTDSALQASVRAQRADRHLTTAVVVRRVAGARHVTDPEISGAALTRTEVVARWRAPDGAARTARVTTASRNAAPGARVRIWTDRAGDPALRPMDIPTAHTHAALAGFGAAMLSALLIECVRRLILRHMTWRRYARIDRAWAAVGPDWGRTGTGS
ncbi:Rv1733c family protein [Streptomyces sp. DT224]|uniref:Rv1733c family protein n=1 Tax=Streptomyces sp. DT224 TaxID=3393426 RepID=UPI003CF4774A